MRPFKSGVDVRGDDEPLVNVVSGDVRRAQPPGDIESMSFCMMKGSNVQNERPIFGSDCGCLADGRVWTSQGGRTSYRREMIRRRLGGGEVHGKLGDGRVQPPRIVAPASGRLTASAIALVTAASTATATSTSSATAPTTATAGRRPLSRAANHQKWRMDGKPHASTIVGMGGGW